PGSDLWFIGPGQQNGGSQVQVDLMNVDSTAASVDVSVINDGGQVQAGDNNGIAVPPHQTVTESLSSVARGSSVLAIEVHTSIGRVAAGVSAESRGVTGWLPGPDAAALVRLTEIAPASRGGTSVTASQVVPVKAGRTLAAPVKAPKGAKHGSPFALVITPLHGSGPLYAARVETQGRSSVVS